MRQEVRFCSAPDGTRLAYAVHGRGAPLVRTATWLTHLEFDWESPLWRHWLEGLADGHMVLRYDERGCGLSDRDIEDVSLDARVADLEAVVDAAGTERVALLGISQGGAGRKAGPRGLSPSVHDALHHASPEQMEWFDELQRVTVDPETAVRIRHVRNHDDVTDEAKQVVCPTLVIHARDDALVPFAEGRLLATLIPGARFVALESRNHILLADEPAWTQFRIELRNFLGPAEVPTTTELPELSFLFEQHGVVITGDAIATLNVLTRNRGPQLMPDQLNDSPSSVHSSAGYGNRIRVSMATVPDRLIRRGR